MKTDMPLVIGVGEVLWDVLPEGKRCGGAPANVVYHLTKLGVPSAVVSAVGADASGDELLHFLKKKGISTEFISRNAFPTGTVTVSLKDGIPSYDIHQPAAWDAIGVPESLRTKMHRVSAVIWGTLAQRCPDSRNAIREILKAVPENCLKCFDVNLRQNFYNAEMIDESMDFCNVLKINEEEVYIAAALLHVSGSRQEILKHFFQRYALRYVICTLGASGSMLYDGKIFTEYPVRKCEVVDTVGCGDAFLAAWCAAVLRGQTAEDGMIAGTERSSFVAGRSGAMPSE